MNHARAVLQRLNELGHVCRVREKSSTVDELQPPALQQWPLKTNLQVQQAL